MSAARSAAGVRMERARGDGAWWGEVHSAATETRRMAEARSCGGGALSGPERPPDWIASR